MWSAGNKYRYGLTIRMNRMQVSCLMNWLNFIQVTPAPGIKREIISERQMNWLSRSVSFNVLIKSIGNLNRRQQTLLNNLEKLYMALGKHSDIRHFRGRKYSISYSKKLLKSVGS